MSEISHRRIIHWPGRKPIFLSLLMLICIGISYVSLVLPTFTRLAQPQLTAGEVAPEDIVAPRTITYNSDILTEQQKEIAARSVPPVYTSPDTSVARHQLERLRATLTYITNVRADTFATNDQKITDLAALEDIHFDQTSAQSILLLNDTKWQAVQQEAIVVLEQVMRSTIREDRLEDARRSVPNLVSLALPEDQAEIVADIVVGFVAPNSFYSESLTETARENASTTVSPVTRTYMSGETVVQRGQVINATDLEALEQFGLVQPERRWQDLVSPAVITFLISLFVLLYLRRKPKLTNDLRGMTLIAVLFLTFLFTGRLLVTGNTLLPYVFPLTAFSLTIASLFGAEPALILTLPLAILYAYNTTNALDLTLYFLLSGFFGVLLLGQARRMTYFFWSGAAIAVSGAAVILGFRLNQPNIDMVGLASLMGVALLNGVASPSLAVLLQFFLAQFLGMTTALQLMEISRPDHPLLQFILRNAPGTYQHSLQVANLAEQAAEQIGADTLLTRVGALYHDAGKSQNPFYFIENQVSNNINPHDELEPAISAATIIQHVPDGLNLAHKYHLPRRIQDFIAEHHGTMLTRYQYSKALDAVDGDETKVDKELYQYPGPRPRSRETAILMLADGSEARVRAERPKDVNDLRALIKDMVENRVASGQLDETDLTFHDLEVIIDSFTTTLRGIYHPRLEYPNQRKTTPPKLEAAPTVPAISRQASDVPVNPQPDG
jgi:putative nucleotidyltransferase with HDIG domain